MEFIFHSVYDDGHHSKFYNIYRIDENHYLAECHHFNAARNCDQDFQIIREGDHWKPSDEQFQNEAGHIAEEIDRSLEPRS
jgi:hypothetical protein